MWDFYDRYNFPNDLWGGGEFYYLSGILQNEVRSLVILDNYTYSQEELLLPAHRFHSYG